MGYLVRQLWLHARNAVGAIIDDINDLGNFIGVNNLLSFKLSIPDNIINHTTASNLSILNNNYTITPPVHQDISHTPTVSDFLNMSNTAYAINGTPKGVKPFLVKGKQLAIQNACSGMAAKVWVTDANQVVIAYQGTGGGDNLVINPAMLVSQVAADIQVWNQNVSHAEQDSLKFAQYVVHEAEKQGFNTNNIFVTGHSLGGIEASYVAQQTGLGGIAFESTGIPMSETTKGTGDNFVSIVTYGDPVGEYASDTAKGSNFVTSMPAGAEGKFDHYGKVVAIGDKADSVAMQRRLADWNTCSLKNVVDILTVIPDFLRFHLPGTQAANMNIALSPGSLLYNFITTQHGPVIPMGNDSILQAMDHALFTPKVDMI